MSKTKKNLHAEESVREREAPAHRARREIQKKVEKYVGPVEEDFLDDEDEFEQFERIRKKHK